VVRHFEDRRGLICEGFAVQRQLKDVVPCEHPVDTAQMLADLREGTSLRSLVVKVGKDDLGIMLEAIAVSGLDLESFKRIL